MSISSSIIVALDYSDRADAEAMADQLDPSLCRVKIGKELFTRAGPDLVKALVQRGFDVFLDLKFHDIPNTTAAAVAAAAELGVWMVNVHASGGAKMMTAARAALTPFGSDAPLLIAVTVLTSMDSEQLHTIGLDVSPATQVLRLAKLAHECGMDGVVCSAQEARSIREACGPDFLRVTPGIRLPDGGADDQKRVMTPQRAIHNGASYLVVGRPVTRAADPGAVIARINEDIAGAESVA